MAKCANTFEKRHDIIAERGCLGYEEHRAIIKD